MRAQTPCTWFALSVRQRKPLQLQPQTDRQTNRQTDRTATHIHTHTHTHIQTRIHTHNLSARNTNLQVGAGVVRKVDVVADEFTFGANSSSLHIDTCTPRHATPRHATPRKMCQGVSRCVKVCQGVSRCVKMCQDVSRCVKVCQGVSRCVRRISRGSRGGRAV